MTLLTMWLSFLTSNFMVWALHLTSGGSFPKPLSAKEERLCLEQIKDGNQEARNRLIEHNLRLVAHIVKKYYSATHDQDDLISIGTIGLIKAVSSFNSDKGIRFATYAARCIENEILMFFRNQRKSAQDVSISDSIDTDKDGNTLTFVDVMATDDTLVDDLDLKLNTEKLHRCIQTYLDQREREIVILRYGLNGRNPLTQREVASLLKISRSYVSRIEKKALEKLKFALDQ